MLDRMVPERREQILDAARNLILRDGFASASMHAIARAVGVTRPVLYAEFGDRDELIAALADREEARIFEMASAATPEVALDADPQEIADHATDIYLDMVRSAPETWQFVLMPAAGTPDSLYERIERGREQIRLQSEALIAAAAALGGLTVDAELLSHAVISASEAAARMMVTADGPERQDEVANTTRWLVRRVVAARLVDRH